MNAIICIDDNNGMLFNKRRQSRDSRVLQNITTLTSSIWISPFSERMFDEAQKELSFDLHIDVDFLKKAGAGEYCFVENQALLPFENKLEQVILYKWNRNYPSDFKLDLNLCEWECVQTEEFAGTSHEKITREIYIKR